MNGNLIGALVTSARDIFVVSGEVSLMVLALLCYSGPLVPMAATLCFKKASIHWFRENRRLLVLLGSVQALSFLPYLLADIFHKPEAYVGLLLPFGVGRRPRIRTVWQVDKGEVAPRLITAYPLGQV